MGFRLFLFFVAGLLCSEAFAQSSREYAARMNASGMFRHDSSWKGAEVIYRSSGVATEADARRWWMNSPPHRVLLVSGRITEVSCVGGVCVGRGSGSSVSTVHRQSRLRIRR